MIARPYRDQAGNYIGAFDEPPANAIECPSYPDHADQKWGGAGWLPLPPSHPSVEAENLRLSFLQLVKLLVQKGVVSLADIRNIRS